MPEGVIDRLEVINVDQCNRQGGMSTNRTRNLRRCLALPGARVEQASLGIDTRGVDELDMPERALEQGYEREGQGGDRYTQGDEHRNAKLGDVILNGFPRKVEVAQAHRGVGTPDRNEYQT